ncbi:MAG TPA: tRNA adenosine(34) deaminase TadA [Candidatus Binatia bacterium]|nr:tRNA adenosine(34) deaminase TadA [Candidatus Binatia bacterium]
MSGDSTRTDDQVWMTAALCEAAQAESENEVPVGAVVVLNGTIIGRGHNSPISHNDPTAHAEIQALREAAQHVGNYRLVGATVYGTVEPCLMCMGALLQARIKRLVFGCADPKAGAAGSLYDVSRDPRLNHQIEVRAGVREEESRALLQDFFHRKRSLDEQKKETGNKENG